MNTRKKYKTYKRNSNKRDNAEDSYKESSEESSEESGKLVGVTTRAAARAQRTLDIPPDRLLECQLYEKFHAGVAPGSYTVEDLLILRYGNCTLFGNTAQIEDRDRARLTERAQSFLDSGWWGKTPS